MTTLVRTRQPLQVLSMSNPPERRYSKRLAAEAVYDEQDGDFLFTRGSKRAKTTTTAAPPPEPQPTLEPQLPTRAKKSVGRPPKASNNGSGSRKRASSPAAPAPAPAQATASATTSTTTTRRTSKRKSSLSTAPASPPPPPATAPRNEEQLVVPKSRTRRKGQEREPERRPPPVQEEEQEVEEPARVNGAHSRGRQRHKKTPSVEVTPMEVDRRRPPDDDPAMDISPDGQPRQIALPFSDTPIINRNKEFRKKGGANGGSRRSSLGMRGRRASSLISNGHSAIPHREVDPAEFYKHIEADGLSEPRRMRQLLTWCGERALSDKPPHGSHGSSAVLGARAIQDQLLKDFGSRSEFSDWFAREEAPKPPVVLKPNPRNIEHDAKIAELEAKIKRLKEEKKAWQALARPLPEVEPLYPDGGEDPTKAPLPDTVLLDPEEAKILSSLTDPSSSFGQLRRKTKTQLHNIQASLEFKVDHLADSVHKLHMRVSVAGREADKALDLSSSRLREREEKEKTRTGTKEMPTMEVLRSLGRILPEGGG
ncbi:Mis12-Mtw1 protein family-domain-containing protein [Diplogelasinospora grovesii]|uniref:Mis12-Mtw1 protein family-domain-containing protein n=1 Tax=Diplogelasinospora grovesii TaxID=303347 RepID=A0AAN6NIS3_9PEZI|nr:Mis12-Mtw1 protein family-domain-containing protein [Diplogelasinospora grovesii]